MKEIADLLGALGTNADKLGALAIALFVIIGGVFGLNKEHIVPGNRFRDERTEKIEYKTALEVANAELGKVKEALIRLQVEKELGWPKLPQRRITRRVRQ